MHASTPLVVILSLVWVLILPSVSSSILVISDNIIVRAALIGIILLALTVGPMEGGIVFFAVCLTFLERNRRKITAATTSTRLGNDGINQTPSLVDKILSGIGLGPKYDSEQVSENSFIPKNNMGSNEFFASGQGSAVLEQKHVLETQPLGSKAQAIFSAQV